MERTTHFIQVSEEYFFEQYHNWPAYSAEERKKIRLEFIHDLAEAINNGKTIVNSSKHIVVHEISQYIISTE